LASSEKGQVALQIKKPIFQSGNGADLQLQISVESLACLFRPPLVADPEFTPFDLESLCGEHPEGSQAAPDNPIVGESEEKYKKVPGEPEKS
jgi:hypothetical protein